MQTSSIRSKVTQGEWGINAKLGTYCGILQKTIDEDEYSLHQDTTEITSHLDTNWIQTQSYCRLVSLIPEMRLLRWRTATSRVIRTPAECTMHLGGPLVPDEYKIQNGWLNGNCSKTRSPLFPVARKSSRVILQDIFHQRKITGTGHTCGGC